jgi:signal transduction histidine kinase
MSGQEAPGRVVVDAVRSGRLAAVVGRSLRARVARLLTTSAVLMSVVFGYAVVVVARSDMLLDQFTPMHSHPGEVESYAQARHGLHVLVLVLLVLALVAVILGAFVWRSLKRDVVDPLAQLAAAARQVAGGDLGLEISSRGVDEVAALAADVEHMRAELAAQVEELRASHAETAEAHEQLRAQAAELERSNRDLEQFAYVASHDLQEPLRKVASFTQLLGKRYRGQLDDRADQYIDFAVDGAKRMQRLIQDLLTFSRVGRAEIRDIEVDLEKVLVDVLRELTDRVAAAEGIVTHDTLPVVHGDPTLMRVVLTNVVGNALKFRRPDVPARVHVGARKLPDAWELSVTDNGIGIDPQYADRVFVIFQRLHPKEVYQGTGIGLALVQRIVEYRGGRVWVVPAPDGGTTVAWTVPDRRMPRRPGSGSRPETRIR